MHHYVSSAVWHWACVDIQNSLCVVISCVCSFPKLGFLYTFCKGKWGLWSWLIVEDLMSLILLYNTDSSACYNVAFILLYTLDSWKCCVKLNEVSQKMYLRLLSRLESRTNWGLLLVWFFGNCLVFKWIFNSWLTSWL